MHVNVLVKGTNKKGNIAQMMNVFGKGITYSLNYISSHTVAIVYYTESITKQTLDRVKRYSYVNLKLLIYSHKENKIYELKNELIELRQPVSIQALL